MVKELFHILKVATTNLKYLTINMLFHYKNKYGFVKVLRNVLHYRSQTLETNNTELQD